MKLIMGVILVLLFPLSVFSEENVLSIFNFKDIKIPEDYFEKSTTLRKDLEPFTCLEIETLLKKKIGSEALRTMIKSRGTSCNPDAQSLGSLKDNGADDKLVAAVSEFALAPNEILNLVVELNFLGYQTAAIKGASYMHIVLSGKNLKPRTVIGNLGEVLSSKWTVDTVESYEDGILKKQVRKIVLLIPFSYREWGKSTFYILQNKSGAALKGKQVKAMKDAKSYEFEYPKFSRKAVCDLEVDLSHSIAMPGKWEIKEADFECDWGM